MADMKLVSMELLTFSSKLKSSGAMRAPTFPSKKSCSVNV